MIMFGCVLARRIVAAAYMPAFGAAPQVQPPSAAPQALDAAISAWFYSRIDSPNALVLFLHCGFAHSSPACNDSTLALPCRLVMTDVVTSSRTLQKCGAHAYRRSDLGSTSCRPGTWTPRRQSKIPLKGRPHFRQATVESLLVDSSRGSRDSTRRSRNIAGSCGVSIALQFGF
jgi:hypothetical protein